MKKKIFSLVVICYMLLPMTVLARTFSKGNTTVCGISDVFPSSFPGFTSGLYDLVKLLVPIVLIVMGMVDFVKAMMANDTNKMKESQNKFINRLIAAVIIFLVMAVVEFVFKQVDDKSNYQYAFVNCMDCILSGDMGACNAGATNPNPKKYCTDYDYKYDGCNGKTDDYGNACILDQSNPLSYECIIWERKQCSDYDGAHCPASDDYDNKCARYNNGSSYGGCRVKGTACEDYTASECPIKTSNGAMFCESSNGKCRKVIKCESYSISQCESVSKGACDWNDKDKICVAKNNTTNTQQNDNGNKIAEYAKKFVGHPYVYGGNKLCDNWNSETGCGVDCSAFVQKVYAHFGYELPRTADAQAIYSAGKRIEDFGENYENLKPGDLIFYNKFPQNGTGIGHVTLYIGNGEVVNASDSDKGIVINKMSYRVPAWAMRFVG